jgi:hypothetical protein
MMQSTLPAGGPLLAPDDAELWRSVDALIDAAPTLDHLKWHRLLLVAADRWRAQGRKLEADVEHAERLNELRLAAAPFVLARIREAYGGRFALIKGYEVAVRFPNPVTRPFADIDLLAEDAVEAHTALRAAGFIEIGDPELYLHIHHLRPLALPGLTVPVEIHREPKWPNGLHPPPTAELLDRAVPSATGIDGIEALAPADHALVLAAHSWAHLPLRRLLELVDIALLSREAAATEMEMRARACGFDRVWRTTKGSVDSLFYGAPQLAAQKLWARHLAGVRERTVFESHVERWLSPFWALPTRAALPVAARAVGTDLSPAAGENWSDKLNRIWKALCNASSAKTVHEQELGHGAHRRRRNG